MTAGWSIRTLVEAAGGTYAVAYQQQPISAADVQSLTQRSSALSDRSVSLRGMAVAAAVVSLICFIVGALISGYLLINFRPA
jgi:hypothetical protein